MRSIGKRNIKKLRAMVIREMPIVDSENVEERVERKIPEEWYDIWEGAGSEIDMIIFDTIMNFERYNDDGTEKDPR